MPLIKACDCVTPLAETLVALSPRARMVLLHTGPESFVLSCLKHQDRRNWIRDRVIAMRRWIDAAFDGPRLDVRDDSEAAAAMWWVQMRLFMDLAARYPERVALFDGEELLVQPVGAIQPVRQALAIPDEGADDAAVRAGWTAVTRRHAKIGAFYVPDERRRELSALRRHYAPELTAAETWLQKSRDQIS